jgi:hypothetical protein
MKTRQKTKLGLALAARCQRLLARIAIAMGRHPKRTVNIAKAGKRVIRTTSDYRSNPKAQRQARKALRAADKARKRSRKLGGQAITDKRVLRDLQTAADGITRALAISYDPPKRHRVRKLAVIAVTVGTTYTAYRFTKRATATPPPSGERSG